MKLTQIVLKKTIKNKKKNNKLISKTQQKFESETRNVFFLNEEINKIGLSSIDD